MKSMHVSRAIGISVLNYAVSFLFTMAIGAYSNFNRMHASDVPNYFLYWGMLADVLTTPLFTWWYLRIGSVPVNAKSGLMFGLAMFLVSFLLDVLLFIWFFFAHYARLETLVYYANPLFWVSMGLMLLLASLTGEWMRKRHLGDKGLTKSP